MYTPVAYSIATSSSVIAIALGLLAMYYVNQLRAKMSEQFAQACRAEHDRAQAAAALESTQAELLRIRERRHAHPTVEMLEDLSAIGDDVDRELEMFHDYISARLQKFKGVIAAGRPGPYAYTSTNTANRPPRPGASVRAWKV